MMDLEVAANMMHSFPILSEDGGLKAWIPAKNNGCRTEKYISGGGAGV